MLEHLQIILVSFSVCEMIHVIGNVYRTPNSNSEDFMSNLTFILKTTVAYFQNSIFYIMVDFKYDLFSINSNNKGMDFIYNSLHLGFFQQ